MDKYNPIPQRRLISSVPNIKVVISWLSIIQMLGVMDLWVAAEIRTLMWTHSRQWNHLANCLINMILLTLASKLHGPSTMFWQLDPKLGSVKRHKLMEKYYCDLSKILVSMPPADLLFHKEKKVTNTFSLQSFVYCISLLSSWN